MFTIAQLRNPEVWQACRNAMQTFAAMDIDAAMELTDEEIAFFDDLNHSAAKYLTVVEAEKMTADRPRAEYLNTLDLMRQVAEHLAGKAVSVTLQKPVTADANGEAWGDSAGVKIALDPGLLWDEDYLPVFLHECAHARLHMEYIGGSAYTLKAEDWGGQREVEARALAAKWQHFAEWHADEYPATNARNKADARLQSKLLALLNSRF